MRLSLYAIDPAAVTVNLAPFHVTYDGLALPPLSKSRFSGEYQEMCEALGFAASPLLLESRIEEAVPVDSPDGMPSFTGPCNTLAISWTPR